mmetsp:Transcript_13677/g.19599  ORF Transcript_13677/g.19599 Transcript_13677/m.19599 type:complete len:152 (+) Transcript_13677:788-1243(+)
MVAASEGRLHHPPHRYQPKRPRIHGGSRELLQRQASKWRVDEVGRRSRDHSPTKPAWKSVAPKSGEATTRERDGKTFNWCIHHKEWCVHTSQECRKKDGSKDEDMTKKKDEKKKKKGSNTSYKMKVMNALAEVSSGDEADHEDCDESCASP